ncbi:MAG: hypothetical protein IJR66_04675 [Clostridia bacterium]|nr:hypothetical protein [Clostridia bacterium]
MDNFNDYVKSQKNKSGKENNGNNSSQTNGGLFNLIGSIAQKFDGKNQNELLSAIYKEAKRGKENGTLSDADVDKFVAMLSPVLDDKKRKILYKVAEDIKKI